eukprot:scaffold51698_cov31-Tisochrysis_lutea.AAC.3
MIWAPQVAWCYVLCMCIMLCWQNKTTESMRNKLKRGTTSARPAQGRYKLAPKTVGTHLIRRNRSRSWRGKVSRFGTHLILNAPKRDVMELGLPAQCGPDA